MSVVTVLLIAKFEVTGFSCEMNESANVVNQLVPNLLSVDEKSELGTRESVNE